MFPTIITLALISAFLSLYGPISLNLTHHCERVRINDDASKLFCSFYK